MGMPGHRHVGTSPGTSPPHRGSCLASTLLSFGALLALCLEGCSDPATDEPGATSDVGPGQALRFLVPEGEEVSSEPTDPPLEATDNLGADPAPPSRAASFLVIGDWGWDPNVHTNQLSSRRCQETIASAMHSKFEELGDVDFVINVGDSFYPNGVSSRDDPQWESKWRAIYSEQLRSVPWFSVYGNHDLFSDNCTCSDDAISECAQVNNDITNLDFFYMPNTSYFYSHPELDLEIIALEMNFEWATHFCQWTLCPNECAAFLKSKQLAAFDLFYKRMEASKATNILVFTHYPTDYFAAYPDFLGNLTTSPGRQITVFGGHRHNVDTRSVASIAPNVAWVVGGGGGWSCDGKEQGFVVGEIGPAGDIRTSPVIVRPSRCCGAR